jgi:hypothetical protein
MGGMPMALNALTGLLTPPGIISKALWYKLIDLFLFISHPSCAFRLRKLFSRYHPHTRKFSPIIPKIATGFEFFV